MNVPRGNTQAVVFLFLLTQAVFAQNSEVRAIATKTVNDGFVVVNGARQTIYQGLSIPSGGLEIQNRDVIQTRQNSFVDARLLPGNNTIHLAENTAAAFSDITAYQYPASYSNSTGKIMTLTLQYGRIRITNVSDNQTIAVKLGNSMVEIKNGDINIEYAPAGAPGLFVSALSGSAVIIPTLSDPGYSRITVNENETITTDTAFSSIKRGHINSTAAPAWQNTAQDTLASNRKLVTRPTASAPAYGPTSNGYTPPAAVSAPANTASPQTYGPTNAAIRTPASRDGELATLKAGMELPFGNNGAASGTNPNPAALPSGSYGGGDAAMALSLKSGGILAGTIFVALGVAMQGFIHFWGPDVIGDNDTEKGLFLYGGYTSIGIGVMTLVSSYFFQGAGSGFHPVNNGATSRVGALENSW